jgi:hypothetical protein
MAAPCGCSSSTHSFNWFNVDGLPCDPCSDTFVCKYHYPAQCAIINVDLPCLELTAPINLQDAFVALNTFVCNSSNITFAGQDSSTIHWTAGGPAGHQPTAAVKISADAGNQVVAHSDGIFVPEPEIPEFEQDWKIKIDVDDDPDFLEDQIIGGSDDDNFIEITVTNNGSGQLEVKPVVDINAIATAVCELCNSEVAQPTVSLTCGSVVVYGTFTLGTPNVGLVTVPIAVVGSGQITVNISLANASFFGTATQTVTASTTVIYVPLFYTGLGSNGTQVLTITISGSANTVTPCNANVEVLDAEEMYSCYNSRHT